MKVHLENENRSIEVEKGESLLNALLRNQIPHKHVCGGKARCSTCRVLITKGIQNLEPRNELETILTQKKGFSADIRLACQTKIRDEISIRRLVLDETDAELARLGDVNSIGQEKEIAVLFSDIRGFTTFAEKSLPYDVIHILNRYFLRVGEAIFKNSGYIDKYIGDGIMALFGTEVPASREEICRSAVSSALDMIEALKELNVYLLKNFHISFNIGIGIHYGVAIIGNLGHPEKIQKTAIGDTVNFASRIEQATKESETTILVSEPIHQILKEEITFGKQIQTEIKGKSGIYNLFEVLDLKTRSLSTPFLNRPSLLGKVLERLVSQKVFPHNSPSIIRLAFHNFFDKECRGLFLFDEVLLWEENSRLEEATYLVRELKKEMLNEGFDLSLSDCIAFASCFAIAICGGPRIQIDLGRTDITALGKKPRFPGAKDSKSVIFELFIKNGFSLREMVALNGAHTLGRAYGVYFTNNPLQFDNQFFVSLLQAEKDNSNPIALDTDLYLIKSPETRSFVELYAQDEAKFFEDFANSFQKLLSFSL